jgi:hypothetical protein
MQTEVAQTSGTRTVSIWSACLREKTTDIDAGRAFSFATNLRILRVAGIPS